MDPTGIGTTKYQLFIKGVRGENVAIIVHKVYIVLNACAILMSPTPAPVPSAIRPDGRGYGRGTERAASHPYPYPAPGPVKANVVRHSHNTYVRILYVYAGYPTHAHVCIGRYN